MAKTQTDNLHLELQEDKTDYLDWDAIVSNWKKIDAAFGEQQSDNSTQSQST